MRPLLLVAVLALGCSGTPLQRCQRAGLCVDCTATCATMVSCRVGFAEADPGPGPQDETSRCERGCMTTDVITPERERCITAVDTADSQRCHDEVLSCLGVDGGATAR